MNFSDSCRLPGLDTAATAVAVAHPQAHPQRAASSPATQARWRASDLFGAAQEIEIQHGDAVYRLRQTALGKLILTK